MQVALQHNAALVLSSDTRHRETDVSFGGLQRSTPYEASKIRICDKHNIAISEAGDGYSSEQAADYIIAKLNALDVLDADFQHFLLQAASGFYQENGPCEEAVLLVVNPHHDHPIWKLHIQRIPQVTKRKDAAIAGHEQNSAIFWKEYIWNKIPDPTAAQLEMIAAAVIMFASSINPSGIRGLEMLTWDGKVWIPRSDEYLAKLKQKCDRIEQCILDVFKET